MNVSGIIVWLVVGALAGTLTGRLIAGKKEGLGRWTNFGVGLVGALIGGYLFNLLNIDLGLGELKFTVEDLIAAVCGSLLFLLGLRFVRGRFAKKKG